MNALKHTFIYLDIYSFPLYIYENYAEVSMKKTE